MSLGLCCLLATVICQPSHAAGVLLMPFIRTKYPHQFLTTSWFWFFPSSYLLLISIGLTHLEARKYIWFLSEFLYLYLHLSFKLKKGKRWEGYRCVSDVEIETHCWRFINSLKITHKSLKLGFKTDSLSAESVWKDHGTLYTFLKSEAIKVRRYFKS